MDKLTEYKVMLVSPRIKSNAELIEKIMEGTDGTNGLRVCMNAYQTEMALMTGLPEDMFHMNIGCLCVAFTEDYRVFGFIAIGVDEKSKIVCTEHAYVRPEVRKKGVYSLMMKRVEKLAKDIKFERIVSFVFDENETSQKAHEKTGFKKRMIGFMKEV